MESWDTCVLNDLQQAGIAKLDEIITIVHTDNDLHQLAENSSGKINSYAFNDDSDTFAMKDLLTKTESSCHIFLDQIDEVLQTLSNLSTTYYEVTGRTNTLMRSCEDLLEQQHKLQATIESMREFLLPFNDIEEISNLLGIPADSKGINASNQLNSELISIDPRSTEFQNILIRLYQCHINLKQYNNFKDYEKYQKWLDQLTHRATTLIARAMKDLLENASKSCNDYYQKKGAHLQRHFEDQPLESAPVYQKFRGLGFRMRELASLLRIDESQLLMTNPNFNLSKDDHEIGNYSKSTSRNVQHASTSIILNQENIMNDVKQHYVVIRNMLLVPVVKEAALANLKKITEGKSVLKASKSGTVLEAPNVNNSDAAIELSHSAHAQLQLCYGIRQAFSTLLRVAQLEQHLYNTLFTLPDKLQKPDSGRDPVSPSTASLVASNIETSSLTQAGRISEAQIYHTEVLYIIEMVTNMVIDFIRPLIIAESNIDELCRIIVTLNEDIRTQFLNLNASENLIYLLIDHLDRIIYDSQERLSYCSETFLRLNIQMFEPLPSQLAYPDLLIQKSNISINTHLTMENRLENVAIASNDILQLDMKVIKKPTSDSSPLVSLDSTENANDSLSVNSPHSIDSVAKSWYPPLRYTLSLLSKLYGIFDMSVFEDFARRVVRLCIQILVKGSDVIKRRNMSQQIHGDLFLVRHLLLLREQLVPFEIKLQSVEKSLDFKNTRKILNSLAFNPRDIVRFDSYNGLLQLAREGIPSTLEKQIDAKQELDTTLRNSCNSFKINSIKLILNPISTFITKVEAFIGEIPVSAHKDKKYLRGKVKSVMEEPSFTATATSSEAAVPSDQSPALNADASLQSTSNQATTLKLVLDDQDVLLSPEIIRNLKSQSFMKIDRIKEIIESSQELCKLSLPELRQFLKLYVENQFARSVLMKPVQQEIELMHRKMETVISNCCEPGSTRRGTEQLLHSVLTSAISELNK